MSQGNITSISKPSEEDLIKYFPDECWHFREKPDKIGIGQDLISADSIGLEHQYGRIFNQNREVRWEGERFWLLYEDDKGDFKVEETEIMLRTDEKKEEYRKIKAVYYLKEGMVVYTRFREVLR